MSIISLISASSGFDKSDTAIGDAALYALVGFVIVIIVLALLVGIFYVSGKLFGTKALNRENLFERKPKQAKTGAASSFGEQTDEELIAVITAAIAAVYADEAGDSAVEPEFYIRRIGRAH